MSTEFNIKCSVPGCSNPVTGQCAGYGANCGRFYCEAHSHNGLCADCATLEAQDQVLEDYVKAAKDVEKQLWRARIRGLPWYFLVVIGLFLASRLMFATLGSDSALGGLLLCAIYPSVAMFMIVSWSKDRGLEKQIVSKFEAVKPEFAGFYKAYKRDKNIRLLKGAAIFTLGAAVAMVTEDLRRSAEEARIQSAVDNELRRHGI